MQALPTTRYKFAVWKVATVGIDYHLDVGGHYHAVPHRFAREKADVRMTVSIFELFHRGSRVASHVRSAFTGCPTTIAGVGKSFLSSALANPACRQGRSTLYVRLPRLLADLIVVLGSHYWDNKRSPLYDIDSFTSARKLLAEIPAEDLDFNIQHDGKPRFASGYNDDNNPVLYRLDDASGKWRTVDLEGGGSRYHPFAITFDDKAVYVSH